MTQDDGKISGGLSNTDTSESEDDDDRSENTSLEEILRNLPESDSKKLISAISYKKFFSGPIPPAEMLREYNEVLPGLADKIVEMADKEQRHRHELEDQDLIADRREAKRGQYLGAATMWLFVIAAVVVTLNGSWQVGIALVAPPIFQQINKLLGRSNSQSQEAD